MTRPAVLLLAFLQIAAAQSFEQLSTQAMEARQASHDDDALKLYREALRLQPSWGDGWWNLGSILYDKAQYAEARDAFQKLTGIDGKAVAGFVFLGVSEYKLKDYNAALRDLDTARTLGLPNTHPLAQSALTYLAVLLNRNGLHDEAARLLLSMPLPLQKPPAILEAIGLTGLRIAKLPEELTDNERDLAAKVGAALAASSTQAITQMEDLVKAYPQRPNLHYLYGMVLLHGDSGQALQEFQKELKIAPESVPSMLAIAHEMERRSQWDDARTYADRAVKAEPANFETHAMLGRIMVSQGHVPEGLSELERARTLEPGSPQVYFALASAYAKLGRNQDAQKARAEFLRLKDLADEDK